MTEATPSSFPELEVTALSGYTTDEVCSNPEYCNLLYTEDGELLTLAHPGVYVSEDGMPFYVVDSNGVIKKQQQDNREQQVDRLLAEGVLYKDDAGKLHYVGETEHRDILDLEFKKLKAPLLPTLYSFELPPDHLGMKPYRTGFMTWRAVYRKPENLIREELRKKLGKEPSAAVLKQETNLAHKYINRSRYGRAYEHSMAQSIYNNGLVAFLADEVWHKDGNAVVQEQTDLYVCGLPVECKRFSNLDDYSVEVDGELYLFVCSAYSFEKKPEGLRYYLLGYRDMGSRVYLSQTYKLGWVGLHEPVVVPTGRVELVEMRWTTSYGEKERGMFVKVSDVINFNTFVSELKKHKEQISKTSPKLDDIEVVKLLYPHLEGQALQQKLEKEQARLIAITNRKPQKDVFDF